MHPATKPSAESSWASTALVRRSYPTVVESREPMLPPHRLPATWVGNTWTWSGRVRIFSWMVRQNCRAARSASLREPSRSGRAMSPTSSAPPESRIAGSRKDAERAARQFCRTIQEKILTLPDHVQVFPTHVAGSLCGGNIGSRLSTTVGYERRTNAVLAQLDSAEGFVAGCISLDDLPAVPPYWKRMRTQNMAGVPLLGVLGEPPALSVDDVAGAQADGAIVLDTRTPEAFGAAHIPNALNVGLGSTFATWAGTVLPADARVVLVLEQPSDLWEASWQLLRIGYPLPSGWLAKGMTAWRITARPVATIEQITVHQLRQRMGQGELAVLDVRQPAEWTQGHIPDATFITGAELPARLDDVPDAPVIALVCGSGYRSSVAASVLAADGRTVVNVLGGLRAWKAAGYPTSG